MKTRILVVEDEHDTLELMAEVFLNKGYRVDKASNGIEALRSVKVNEPDIILTDILMPGMDGMELLRNLAKEYPHIPVIMITAYGTIDNAVEAMKLGAKDYITKPLRFEELTSKVERITQLSSLIKENEFLLNKLQQKYDFTNIIGKTSKIKDLLELVRDVAATNATALIRGESGTGKELIANAIHYNSQRMKRPFIKVNCAVLAESLLESELFGHVKGAFTGAIKDKVGRFELANGGTLFLDEIGDISLKMQSQLLRVLQVGEFERVGGTETLKVDVRIIAATNKNLEEAMERGEFRQDLFYRLNVIPITVPPLRERREDIQYLVSHFIEKFNKIYGKNIREITPKAMAILKNYDYPGNIRELENLIERIVVLNRVDVIDLENLPSIVPASSAENGKINLDGGLTQAVEEYERKLILMALEENGYNKVQTAKALKINRSTFNSKLKKYSIN
ncbi:MAG TPA: sigma-54-dependent Fis family transcriptional regulator [Caldithrix abyssi]|uniref:Sigma-54-dependent Fis family transcriptional regulator n=1 Tax=Caldithrix abyssi TaxID=187145 RepID=A0A7V5RPE7_CALAY|nr:sigma-54-dependent Fis family transcriptional regulator [Caldithrix abyssi]